MLHVIFSLLLFQAATSSNILGIFPYPGKSHFLVFQPLMEELARKGHLVTVISFHPRAEPLKNYVDINLGASKMKIGFCDVDVYENKPFNKVWSEMEELYYLGDYEPVLKSISDLTGNYDLAIVEAFNTDIFFALVQKLGIPYIGFSSHAITPWHASVIGNPEPMPSLLSERRRDFTLETRIYEFFDQIIHKYWSMLRISPKMQAISNKYISDIPLDEAAANMSLLLLNSHPSIFGSVPFLPMVIEVGGIHVKTPKLLQPELEKTIQDSKAGVIYFSMGSVINGSSMTSTKGAAFTKVFSELPQTVLWKREDKFKGPKNMKTSGWFPQRDILAHPNVKLFISHCGLLGTNEAMASGVPMVCIPMFGDQHQNARSLEAQGAAVYLEFSELNEMNIRNAIKEVLQNPSYKENAVRVQKAFWDRPMTALDTAVYWVEYVIRHKGAHHLKSSARLLTWYEYHNVDVMLIIISVIVLFLLMINKFLCLIFRILKFLCCNAKSKTKIKTN